ncbi:unnamed protein product [Effrenium voratum]|uniref:Abhydrolase domain-containing 18 n=1 Tax=Effrenium voratum TaxID=2562239 RepID=A0AA36JH16_9DINO|nr:unnamed protein product [Effrenium voratum]
MEPSVSRVADDPQLSWPKRALGLGCGLVDQALGRLSLWKPFSSARFFAEGWGPLQELQDGRERLEALISELQARPAPPDVLLGPEQQVPGGTLRQGSFRSSFAEHLPQESHLCHFELLAPKDPWAVVLHFPGTADQSYGFRKWALAKPLLQQGVASLLMMPPFYGPRRPKTQQLHYIRTVVEFCQQSSALLLEAVQLLDWLSATWPSAKLATCGISWGGAMASALGILAKRHDLAVIPLLASASPEVLISGALRGEVAFSQLSQDGLDLKEAESMLRGLLLANSTAELHRFMAELPGRRGTKVVTQVSAFHDAFVDRDASRLAFGIMQELDPNAELQWVTGGHASSHVAARYLFLGSVISALERLPGPGGDHDAAPVQLVPSPKRAASAPSALLAKL